MNEKEAIAIIGGRRLFSLQGKLAQVTLFWVYCWQQQSLDLLFGCGNEESKQCKRLLYET